MNIHSNKLLFRLKIIVNKYLFEALTYLVLTILEYEKKNNELESKICRQYYADFKTVNICNFD